MRSDRHSFNINDSYTDVLITTTPPPQTEEEQIAEQEKKKNAEKEGTFVINQNELSIHVATFVDALRTTKNTRAAVEQTLKSAYANPEDKTGRMTFARYEGQGKPTIVEWMEERGLIKDYEIHNADGVLITDENTEGSVKLHTPDTDSAEAA